MTNSPKENRDFLFQLLKLRKDKRFRNGLLQGAVSFRVISQKEWIILNKQAEDGIKIPTLQD